MSNDLNKASTELVEKPKPELVTIGGKQVIDKLAWNDDLITEQIVARGVTRWTEVSEMARWAWGRNTPTNQARARTRLWRLRLLVAERYGLVLVTERGKYRKASAVKLLDPSSKADRQFALADFKQMQRRRDLTPLQRELFDRLQDAVLAMTD